MDILLLQHRFRSRFFEILNQMLNRAMLPLLRNVEFAKMPSFYCRCNCATTPPLQPAEETLIKRAVLLLLYLLYLIYSYLLYIFLLFYCNCANAPPPLQPAEEALIKPTALKPARSCHSLKFMHSPAFYYKIYILQICRNCSNLHFAFYGSSQNL